MPPAASALPLPIDVRLGGLLLANMLAAWLDDNPKVLSTGEASHESQDRRTSPEPTSLRVFTPVDAVPSPPPSGEHGASVRTAREGAGTGLERIPDPHAGSGPGQDGHRNGSTGGLQDLGGGGLDGASGRGVCLGGLAAGTLESGLA